MDANQIISAIDVDSSDTVASAISGGYQINQLFLESTTQLRMSTLDYAVLRRSLSVATTLITLGASTNVADSQAPALVSAISISGVKQLEWVTKLLRLGANPNTLSYAFSPLGQTALMKLLAGLSKIV
jgi:hypothetical protein